MQRVCFDEKDPFKHHVHGIMSKTLFQQNKLRPNEIQSLKKKTESLL